MVDGHPVALRERAVAAYEAGKGSYPVIAELFGVGEASVKRWVWLKRNLGNVEPKAAGGGRCSTITLQDIELALTALPDGTALELTAELNRTRPKRRRVHVSSTKRALARHGYVGKKKRRRPSERADVAFKRTHFAMKIRRIPFERLVFLDESGLNLAMSRSRMGQARYRVHRPRSDELGQEPDADRRDAARRLGRAHDDL